MTVGSMLEFNKFTPWFTKYAEFMLELSGTVLEVHECNLKTQRIWVFLWNVNTGKSTLVSADFETMLDEFAKMLESTIEGLRVK